MNKYLFYPPFLKIFEKWFLLHRIFSHSVHGKSIQHCVVVIVVMSLSVGITIEFLYFHYITYLVVISVYDDTVSYCSRHNILNFAWLEIKRNRHIIGSNRYKSFYLITCEAAVLINAFSSSDIICSCANLRLKHSETDF